MSGKNVFCKPQLYKMENQILDDESMRNDELLEIENQKEEKQVVVAPRRKRFYAYLIDIIPITIIVSILFSNFGEAASNYFSNTGNIQTRIEFLMERNKVRIISFLIWVIYCIIMDASSFYGSFGKYLVGIKVIDEYGERLTIQRSFIRNSTKIISQAVLSLGFVWILFDKKRQGWHDKIAKTLVVEDESVMY